jgi:hypothetical protein
MEFKITYCFFGRFPVESFEMWCWRRMEKISWPDHVRNEDALLRVKEKRNILHEIRKRKANWIDHILRRNCLLQNVIEGKIKVEIEVTGRQGRRRRKLLDDLKEKKGYDHMARMVEDRDVHRVLVGKPEGKRPLGRPRHKWDYNIKMDFQEVLGGGSWGPEGVGSG